MAEKNTVKPTDLAFLFESVCDALSNDARLWQDFLAICGMGGRLAGTPSEAAAIAWCGQALANERHRVHRDPTPYKGWRCDHFELRSASDAKALDAVPLLGTASTPEDGLTLDVLNLGRGTLAQIQEAGERIRGKAVLVQHEYPFCTDTTHRRLKLAAVQEAGAAAFLIVQQEPGIGPVSGSSGRAGRAGIPAAGISRESAADLLNSGSQIFIRIQGQDLPEAQTSTLRVELPGQTAETIVLTAHLDGHPLAESALDNATGVAAALALIRAFAPLMPRMRRGLTMCLFSAEEWALRGSQEWLQALPVERKARMAMNLNLDSLTGSANLTALSSGFFELGQFAVNAAKRVGVQLGHHLPLMTNSDHANFAAHGIPAMRLIAGFNEPDSDLKYILTRADKHTLVQEPQLRSATLAAAAILWEALTAAELSHLKHRSADQAS